MTLSTDRYAKIDDELKRAAAYFERLAAEVDPGADAGAVRAAWAKSRAIVAQIEELRWLLAQDAGSRQSQDS
jgi:hypothetical protein